LLVGESEVALSPGYGQLVRNAIRTYKLKGAIHLTGQVADARPYIRAMDVLVNPSEREGFGLTLIEAMSEGVPVIAVRAGGPAEIVEHEHTGFLIARRDTRMLAEALVVLHRDSGLRERLATAATDVAASRFSGAAMARRFEAAMRAWVAG
jgi:glycosyltransferase involved in cell wall biosynthesis